MKRTINTLAALMAAASFADTPLVWEDVPPTSVVSQVVRRYAPPADLAPATNYTDAATNSLAKSFAPTITNIAPTRAEVEAGWFSEWDFTHAPTLIENNPELKWSAELGAWVVYLDGEVQTSFPGSIDDIRVNLGDNEYATRHRVAAPVPTKTSDLVNDGSDGAHPFISQNEVQHQQLAPVYGGNGKQFSEWVCVPPDVEGKTVIIARSGTSWSPTNAGGEPGDSKGDNQSTSLTWDFDEWWGWVPLTATRTKNPIIGYTLGTQTNSILAATNGIVTAETATNIASSVVTSATNSLAKSLAPTITNISSTVSSSAIANADTTYRRTIGLTNLNQSVQYVNVTDATPSTLEIQLPTDGATKDWIVYVTSVTNVSLVLPSATWWMADAAYTNDVPPATPTALWFSQVTDGIFILGRQELTPVTITTEE